MADSILVLHSKKGLAMKNELKSNLRKSMMAGKAIVTFVNEKTGNRFTYRIKMKKDMSVGFVSLLGGCDNENDYRYLGCIFDGINYTNTKKSTISKDAQSNRVFEWVWNHLDNLPSYIKVLHSGRCLRCARLLTVPESIESGFGPECVKYQ